MNQDTIRQKEAATDVYILSVVLSQIQSSYRQRLEGIRNSSQGRTLNRLAILLTRGTKAEVDRTVTVAAAGPFTANGMAVEVLLASSPKSPGNPTNVSSPTSYEQELARPDYNAYTMPQSVFDSLVSDAPNNVKLWEGSTGDESDMYSETQSEDPIVFRPAYRYPNFHTFAETLFRVNKASGRYHSPLSAAYFAIPQCSRYAFSRSEAVCKLFLVEHDLREWCPKKDEKITSELVTIHSEAHYTHLLAHNIVGEPHPTRPRYWNYPFDSSNCHDWLLALLTAIVDLRTSLRSLILSQQQLAKAEERKASTEQPMRECKERTMAATTCSVFLHGLLEAMPMTLWDIISLNSLILQRCRSRVVRVAIPAADSASDAETLEAPPEEDIIEENISNWAIPDKWEKNGKGTVGDATHGMAFSPLLTFIRAVDAITVWTTSAFAISTHKFAQSDIPLSFSIYDLPDQQPNHIPTDVVERAADRWIASSQYLSSDSRKADAKTNIMRAWANGNSATAHLGSCHCEAGTMADKAAKGSPIRKNGAVELKTFLIELGVAKMSCALCMILKETLEEHYKLRIELPGCDGLYIPWYPPASLTTDVLVSVERKATCKLHNMLPRSLRSKQNMYIPI